MAGRATATGRSSTMRRRRGIVAAIAVTACVGVAIAALAAGETSTGGRASEPFAWLHAASPPIGWKIARADNGAMFSYPPAWRPIRTDPGTASVALLSSGGQIEGFLNATPRQGGETLENWSRFRPQHNRREGDRDVRLLAAIRDARVGSGRVSCVIDTYTTIKAHYREIACLVAGPNASAVVVGATPSALENQPMKTLERAVTTFVS
jgi:hypothetical protein